MVLNVGKFALSSIFVLILMISCSVMYETDEPEVTKTDTANIRTEIVADAKTYVRTRYRYASTSPNKGFDCSGFSSFILNKFGLSVPRSTAHQAKLGRKIKLHEAQEGDLIFFGKRKRVSHVALVVKNDNGNITVVHSTNSKGVIVENINNSRYWKRRVLFARDVVSTDTQL